MKKFVQSLIEKKKKLYKDNYHEMLGDYNRELETVKGYNGRQILELLQNCDDEEAKKVFIKLDENLKTITISNDGQPFSEKGYRSLFIANLSSKTSKRKYIGNKGLGFRSIINWSNSIEIHSNSISLIYSEANVANNFRQIFSEEFQKKIRGEEKLNVNVVPMALLSAPKLNDIKKTEYATSIIIHYKNEFYNDIQDQIKKITSEILLFLRYIEEIKFEGFEDKEDIICKREIINKDKKDFVPTSKITFNDYTWYIFEEEKKLPKEISNSNKIEEEYYQIKIAVEEKFEHSYPNLFSFFPTNIILDQPYVLHATFDLDSTRNQINDSDKNKYLLEKIVSFTIDVAKFYTAGLVSFKALEILNHEHFADTLYNLEYYDLIEEAIKSETIFPCIDNTYKKLKDVIYVSDKFASILIDIKANEIFDFHILPIGGINLTNSINVYIKNKSLNNVSNIEDIINQIGLLDLSIAHRALFIGQIVKECSFLKILNKNSIDFLVSNNGKIIKGEDYIYTPVTQNNTLEIPKFVKIKFVNQKLFNFLVEDLGFSINQNKVKTDLFLIN
jgi:hypothetical protein